MVYKLNFKINVIPQILQKRISFQSDDYSGHHIQINAQQTSEYIYKIVSLGNHGDPLEAPRGIY